MQYEDQIDPLYQKLGRQGQAELAGFMTDLATEPRPAEIVRKSRKEQEAEKADESFRQFQEACEVESALTNIRAGHDRLRSSHTEPDTQIQKVLGGLPEKGTVSIAFRPGRAELPLAKAEGSLGNRGGQAPPRFERPADADEFGAWFPGDEDFDKGLNTKPSTRKEVSVELELQK